MTKGGSTRPVAIARYSSAGLGLIPSNFPQDSTHAVAHLRPISVGLVGTRLPIPIGCCRIDAARL
jgi:hypothetical protein